MQIATLTVVQQSRFSSLPSVSTGEHLPDGQLTTDLVLAHLHQYSLAHVQVYLNHTGNRGDFNSLFSESLASWSLAF